MSPLRKWLLLLLFNAKKIINKAYYRQVFFYKVMRTTALSPPGRSKVCIRRISEYTGPDGVPLLQDFRDAPGGGGGQGDRPLPPLRRLVVRLRGDPGAHGRASGGC